MKALYEYRDYKDYLRDESERRGQRSGFKSGLAQASRCNNAYVSAVLKGKAHFSLEQAERLCRFLGFSEEESHYFLLLVQRGRAGTTALQLYFDQQIHVLKEQNLNVQKRLGVKDRLSKQDQSQYYSSWMYAAIHVALSVPRLNRSPEVLAQYFNLPLGTVKKVLDFLLAVGLGVRQGGTYAIGSRHIHLGNDSENIIRHHSNWRQQVMRCLELRSSERGLNYSSAVALSREDALKVREILLQAVKSSVETILKSPEEEVFLLSADFMPIGDFR